MRQPRRRQGPLAPGAEGGHREGGRRDLPAPRVVGALGHRPQGVAARQAGPEGLHHGRPAGAHRRPARGQVRQGAGRSQDRPRARVRALPGGRVLPCRAEVPPDHRDGPPPGCRGLRPLREGPEPRVDRSRPQVLRGLAGETRLPRQGRGRHPGPDQLGPAEGAVGLTGPPAGRDRGPARPPSVDALVRHPRNHRMRRRASRPLPGASGARPPSSPATGRGPLRRLPCAHGRSV
ncbi:hypothetical protein SGPA1_21638 [Streptomyces misionensis JCM 4497]